MRIPYLLALPIALATPLAANATGNPVTAEMIGRIAEADANHDGTVTRREMLVYRAANFGRFDRNRDGKIDNGDIPFYMRSSSRVTTMFAQYDVNRDKVITQQEFVNGPLVAFDYADADRNGSVSRAEISAAKARLG